MKRMCGSHGLSVNDVPFGMQEFVFSHGTVDAAALRRVCSALQFAVSASHDSLVLQRLQDLAGPQYPLMMSHLEVTLARHFLLSADPTVEAFVNSQALTLQAFRCGARFIAEFLGTSRFAPPLHVLPSVQSAVLQVCSEAGYDSAAAEVKDRECALRQMLAATGLHSLLACTSVQQRLYRHRNYRDHPEYTSESVALKLQRFARSLNLPKKRERWLRSELEEWGIPFSTDHDSVQLYVEAVLDMDTEEVAALLLLEGCLRKRGKPFALLHGGYALSVLHTLHLEHGQSWRTSAELTQFMCFQ